ncbi:MAG: polysaccharide deacetylase family protein [Terriglobia bacterium]
MYRKHAMAVAGTRLVVLMGVGLLFHGVSSSAAEKKPFQWPAGKRLAISLSFDDARLSQPDVGLPLLERLGVKATFFVEPRNVEPRLEGWKKIVAAGHEIGNHSQSHPCTGNYAFSLSNALEDYSLERMAKDLDGGAADIERLLGVKPRTFGYPCGLKFVGRGRDVRSYVPLIAERYLVGRGYMDEAANDPAFCDLAQAMGTPFDDTDFAGMKKQIDQAAKDGRWIIFVGHEIGKKGFQVTDTAALEELCKYAQDPANGIWIDTVENIGEYVQKQREGK